MIVGLNRGCGLWPDAVQAEHPELPPVRLLQGPFQALSAYEATLLDEVTALLIPTDQDPGAREAGVVAVLDRALAAHEQQRTIYRSGFAWLDFYANALYGQDSFLLLPPAGRLRMLELAESGRVGRLHKLKEWWRFGTLGHGVRFFELVKADTFAAFYTARQGWQVAGYHGPPQYRGFPDYARCG
ncbi:hypothetical protein YTPLAS18_13010 [Nitrospira sp.]|nr:hypothetical protein YTPLAS18_13010 [Nitrospira sp.]